LQADVYQSVVNPLIKQVLKGYNCTVFAYGQTGTGKTFTMEGLKDYDGSWEQDPDAGIIPRSLVEIFNARQKGGFDKDNFQIKVSFLELYNEEIFDLLCSGMDMDKKQ
jgi:kinesin family protein 11